MPENPRFRPLLALTALSAAAVPLSSQPTSVPKPLSPGAVPAIPCEASKFTPPRIPGAVARIVSAAREQSLCAVTASVIHPPAGGEVRIEIWLPAKNWNGRFLGLGGGGFRGGSPARLPGPVAEGWAAAVTDTGHAGAGGSFALDSSGKPNWVAIRNFGHVAIHEMTVVGKALAEQFYRKAPQYSYFEGCSTGGRQALMEVQRYPDDYDGVIAGAPGINMSKLHVAQMWGQLVMKEARNYPPPCKLTAVEKAAVASCDRLDGLADGVIEDPRVCRFDPRSLVGTAEPSCDAFTEADARVVSAIMDGPRRADGSRLWYGLPPGAGLLALNRSAGSPPVGQPMGISLDWWKYFLGQNPAFDWTALTRESFEQYFDQSVEQYTDVMGTSDPNLKGFRDSGGKVIVWHGWNDPFIYAQGTIEYIDRVRETMGASTASFLRFYLAPGVFHCGGGPGPVPLDLMEAIRLWVEEGRAPERLPATRPDGPKARTRTRSLCAYPLIAKYKGNGSTDDDTNFDCVPAAAAPVIR